MSRPRLEVGDTLRVVVEPDRDRLIFIVGGVLAFGDGNRLGRIVPAREQPCGDRRRRRRALGQRRTLHAQQRVRHLLCVVGTHRPQQLHGRVVGHVRQPDDLRLFGEDADRTETKLIGFLQELVQLANPALDDVAHDKPSRDSVGLSLLISLIR